MCVYSAIDVLARGELQIGILVETMRREGFELTISPPHVLSITGTYRALVLSRDIMFSLPFIPHPINDIYNCFKLPNYYLIVRYTI